MPTPAARRHRAPAWSTHDASPRERESPTVRFDPPIPRRARPSGGRAGRAVHRAAAIQACLTVEVPIGLPHRRTNGFVASLPRLTGLDWPAPGVSTPCRRICPTGPRGGPLASVAASDARGCRDAIANPDADADPVIPPQPCAETWGEDGFRAAGRSGALRAIRRLGRSIWRRRSGHHRRRRAETKATCTTLPGRKLAVRDLNRQAAELQARIGILNRPAALGIPIARLVK